MILKHWMESFLSIPLPSYLGFTFSSMRSLAYNLLVLFRFSTPRDQNWNISLVKEYADILEITDLLVDNYNHIAKSVYVCPMTKNLHVILISKPQRIAWLNGMKI